MVLVEDAPRLGDVDRRLLGQRPGQLDQPVEIGAHHAVFAGRLRHALAAGAAPCAPAPRPPSASRALAIASLELGDLGGLALVAFAELPLDRRHLLAQQHLALALVERRLGLLADLARQAQHLDAVGEQARDPVDAARSTSIVSRISCFSSGVDVHVGRDQVGERRRACSTPWIAATSSGGACGRSCSASSAWPLRWTKRASISSDIVRRLRDPQHARDEERPAVEELDDAEALLALADEMMGAVRRGDVAHDVGDRAHPVQVDRQRDRRSRRRAASGCRPAAARAPPAARPRSSAGGRA